MALFSRTVRPRRLKLGTYVDSGQMYRVYRNPAAATYSSLYFFIFFLSNFQTLKFFVTLLSGAVRPRRLKLGTHVDWVNVSCIPESGCCCLFVPIFFIFSFSNIQTLKIFVTLFSGTVRPRRLTLVHTWTMGGCIEHRNQAAVAYLSLYFFIFLSPIFKH